MNKLFLPLLGAVAVLACEPRDWGPDKLGLGKSNAEVEQLRTGREVYANYCAGCHGDKGDGNGPAARFLSPKPRDFRLGRIKFAAVASGEAPRDEDYIRIISHGLSGTSMPSFDLLSAREKSAVVAYVKSYYSGWKEDGQGGQISAGKDPWSDDPAAGRAEGRKVYHGLAKCWSCHPAYETPESIKQISVESSLPEPSLRENLYEGEVKDSQWGAPIKAPDFLIDRVKNGNDVNTIALVVASGVGGTAMPTWAGALEPEQIWGLAYYVQSIAALRATPKGKSLREELLRHPVPPAPADPEPSKEEVH